MRYEPLVVLLLSCSLLGQQPQGVSPALKRTLSKQGFSGALKGRVHLSRLGDIACNAEEFQVFFYAWEESNPAGAATHAAYRIVLLRSRDEYVGSYPVADRPIQVTRDSLIFDYLDDSGNVIRCDRNGFPATVLLDGEERKLAK